jgi:hypothetical protein
MERLRRSSKLGIEKQATHKAMHHVHWNFKKVEEMN